MNLSVHLGNLAEDAHLGDSIAVNGVCLTVSRLQAEVATFEVSSQTLASSTLGNLRTGSKVNVERSLRADSRFGGHFVLGHVDGTAMIKAIDKRGQFADWTFATSSALLEQILPKGSIAVDGISLTVAQLQPNAFTVATIPETLARTTLCDAKIGNIVNIETDIVVKTVIKQLGNILPADRGLTIEKLREMGY